MKENRTLLSLLPSVVFAEENVNVTLKGLKKIRKTLCGMVRQNWFAAERVAHCLHPPGNMSSLAPCDRDRELVNSSVCVPILWWFPSLSAEAQSK